MLSDDGLTVTVFTISLKPDSQLGRYYHISYFRLYHNFIDKFITIGKYDVTKLLFFDKSTQILYFQAINKSIKAENPNIELREQHIYRVNVSDRDVQCMTCRLTFTDCHYFEAFFSLNAHYYVIQCLGPNVPKVYLLKLDQQNNSFEWEGNEGLQNKLTHKLDIKHHIYVVNTSNNKKIYIKLLVPPEFDDEVVDKYPLIIEANDDETQVLSGKHTIDWAHYLVTKHHYIYGWIESNNDNFRHKKINNNYESFNENTDKYRIAIKHIKDDKRFINPHKMCIWGKSIDAFVAISSLASSDILNCAVLVSPVLNWKLMDVVTYEYLFNIWQSYEAINFDNKLNLINKIEKLITKHILIIHGSADEKASIQHSMQFIKQLISKYTDNDSFGFEPLLQFQIYPDEDNSLSTIRHHFYQRIHLFFEYIFSQSHRHHMISSNE
ncbi:inactive dipeptidyl peptidase 10-like [Oppia nitens]|uniref:inactive dipeptidyl peptidase 10-like n=1 Tax=Oppia nitens TaxID=1686743 RepID=UPI0023DA17CD|nr:inactive dipeptidyl peptidase 10-like [Oppia nitens]